MWHVDDTRTEPDAPGMVESVAESTRSEYNYQTDILAVEEVEQSSSTF